MEWNVECARIKSYDEVAFCYYGPRLPGNLRAAGTVDGFKTQLFSLAFLLIDWFFLFLLFLLKLLFFIFTKGFMFNVLCA